MRKLSLLALLLTLFVGVGFAQDAGKLVKSGSKALSKYIADNDNTSALREAQSAADEATSLEPSDEDTWLLKGNAYAAEVNARAKMVETMRNEAAAAKLTGGSGEVDYSKLTMPAEAAETAIEAFQMAYEKADKSSDKKKAISSLQTLSGSLSSLGNAMLDGRRYADAYAPLNLMMDVDRFYVSNNETPLFPADSSRDQQKYIMAVVARQTGNTEDARMLHKELYDKGYNNAAIYAGYSQILTADGDEAGAVKALERGRQLFPDDSEILFAEINYYIQKQDFNTLETKLQEAIAKEPDNTGLYNALGNVYMNLSQAEGTEEATSKSYMDKSIQYFSETLDREEDNVDATYSIGSLYYNKAVGKVAAMNELGTSKADQARYDELNSEISELFDKALPYFIRAEKIDPNDRNTLIALKEIYARQNDFEKSKIYKDRLQNMDGK